MSLPRLHPEDLAEIIIGVSNNVNAKIEEIFSKQRLISELQVLSPSDVAKILTKDETTIYRYLKKGIIKGTKPGGEWIITQSDLLEYISGIED